MATLFPTIGGVYEVPGKCIVWKSLTTASACVGWPFDEVTRTPVPPKELVPVDRTWPGIALTKTARIARKYLKARK
jgi:hypothetical protein